MMHRFFNIPLPDETVQKWSITIIILIIFSDIDSVHLSLTLILHQVDHLEVCREKKVKLISLLVKAYHN